MNITEFLVLITVFAVVWAMTREYQYRKIKSDSVKLRQLLEAEENLEKKREDWNRKKEEYLRKNRGW